MSTLIKLAFEIYRKSYNEHFKIWLPENVGSKFVLLDALSRRILYFYSKTNTGYPTIHVDVFQK